MREPKRQTARQRYREAVRSSAASCPAGGRKQKLMGAAALRQRAGSQYGVRGELLSLSGRSSMLLTATVPPIRTGGGSHCPIWLWWCQLYLLLPAHSEPSRGADSCSTSLLYHSHPHVRPCHHADFLISSLHCCHRRPTAGVGPRKGVVKRPRDCTLCRECIRKPEQARRIKLEQVSDHFICECRCCFRICICYCRNAYETVLHVDGS